MENCIVGQSHLIVIFSNFANHGRVIRFYNVLVILTAVLAEMFKQVLDKKTCVVTRLAALQFEEVCFDETYSRKYLNNFNTVNCCSTRT